MLPVRAILVGLSILGLAASAQPPETASPPQQATGKLNVFIFAGQSNMEGRADGAKLFDADRERLSRVKDRITLAFNGESVRPLGPVAPSPEIGEIYKCEQIFGPELFFGIAMAEAWPQERFLFIKRTASARRSMARGIRIGARRKPPLRKRQRPQNSMANWWLMRGRCSPGIPPSTTNCVGCYGCRARAMATFPRPLVPMGTI